MTMTAFLPFDRKPQKTIASMICKYSNMVAKPTTGAEWMFQGPVKRGRGSMLVQIVDFRDFLTTEHRVWADDVGWDHNWAIAISVSHKRRTDEEYAFWHAFALVLQNAYEGNGLVSNEVWLSAEEEGFPTTPYTVEELFPDLISSEADDVAGPFETDAEVEQEPTLPPEQEPTPLPPPPRFRAEPAQEEDELSTEEEFAAINKVAEIVTVENPIEDAEPPDLRLIPVDFGVDEEEDEVDEHKPDAYDEDDEDDEDDWSIEGEDSDAITDW
jgi:hypothetical protein